MAKQNLESSVKEVMPKWKPAYTQVQIRYWLRSYWNANRIALPENLDAMKREQLYAIYKRIRAD